MTSAPESSDELLHAKLNLETARISWRELQRFFAMGSTLSVSTALDLVDVGFSFARDDAATVGRWLEEGTVAPVSDELARHWLEKDADLWCLVVRPWVLVQDKP